MAIYATKCIHVIIHNILAIIKTSAVKKSPDNRVAVIKNDIALLSGSGDEDTFMPFKVLLIKKQILYNELSRPKRMRPVNQGFQICGHGH